MKAISVSVAGMGDCGLGSKIKFEFTQMSRLSC